MNKLIYTTVSVFLALLLGAFANANPATGSGNSDELQNLQGAPMINNAGRPGRGMIEEAMMNHQSAPTASKPSRPNRPTPVPTGETYEDDGGNVDVFSVLLRNSKSYARGRVKMTCYSALRAHPNPRMEYTEEENMIYDRAYPRWTSNVRLKKHFDERRPGHACREGYMVVALDPDGPNGTAEWIRVGRLDPCEDDSKMKFAWVTYVSENIKHAIMQSKCISRRNHRNLPEPNSEDFETMSTGDARR